MRTKTLLRPLLLAATTAVASMSSVGSAQASLLDFLFGGGSQAPAPAPRYYSPSPSYGGPPLGVRVNPRRKNRDVAGRPSGGRDVAGRSGTGRDTGRKGPVQVSINPAKHPNWHLEDPTLRRGDIVVLKSGVMVYDGGPRPQAREDFTVLSRSSLVSKTEKERIQKMAGPPSAPEDPATQGKAASLSTTPTQ